MHARLLIMALGVMGFVGTVGAYKISWIYHQTPGPHNIHMKRLPFLLYLYAISRYMAYICECIGSFCYIVIFAEIKQQNVCAINVTTQNTS